MCARSANSVDGLDDRTRALIAERLGREPRGLRAVAVWDDRGEPMVIRVASLVEGKPFPTLYWLIDPALSLRLDREEAGGLIAKIQDEVDGSEQLQEFLAVDHRKHIALRESFLNSEERASLHAHGLWGALSSRGIGGIGNFDRVRCLHTWYASHLVVPNTVGRLVDEYWSAATG
ncbi:MAG: DUF501 domain-containing protein [Pseudomonadota bacterium]